MSRKRLVLYAGVALLAGLYSFDNARKSTTLEPANVITVSSITPDEGRDRWRVMFELSDRKEYASEPLSQRPDYALGDPLCIAVERRTWAAPTYRVTDQTSCWTGATTPLRGPDQR